MIALLLENPHSFWLSMGGVCLTIEMLGTYGYLLWSGIAALIIGILVYFLPNLPWSYQGAVFAILIVLVAFLWWFWITQSIEKNPNDKINQRKFQLIGSRAILMESMHNNIGRINIGDGSWRAQSDHNIPIGTAVQVIEVKSTTLVIRKISY